MDDARWDFLKNSADAKRIAHSAAKMNRTGKGAVRMPSDYLNREDKKKYMEPTMLSTTGLSAPMSYKQFKKLRPENQKMQLEIWGNVYGHTSTIIAQVMHCSSSTAYCLLESHGLSKVFVAKHKDDKLTGKIKEQKMNLARILSDVVKEPVDVLPAPAESTADAASKPAEPVSVAAQQTTPPEPQNVVQTHQSVSVNSPDNGQFCNTVLDVKMEGRFIKGAVQGLDDGKTYRIVIQEF